MVISLDKTGLDKIKSAARFDLKRNHVRRIFSNNSFEQGGRFYGGWWQDLAGEIRSHILLNGKPTVELDFGAMVVHQAYASKNLNYWKIHEDDDPYSLNGSDYPRPIKKIAFQCCLNTQNRGNAATALIGEINGQDEKSGFHGISEEEALTLITMTVQKHEQIADVLFSKPALRFQHQDSMICEEVIARFLELGKAILTVHDSFLVELDQEILLRRVMEHSFKRVCGNSVPQIKTTCTSSLGLTSGFDGRTE